MEQKSNDKIEKMPEEMDNKLEAILREIKTNKSSSTVTNPRSDANEMQGSQQSGSRIDKSIGVHASNNENSDYENDDFPPKVSKMKDLKHPADPLYQIESDVDVTILPDEESEAEEVEDYHKQDILFLKILISEQSIFVILIQKKFLRTTSAHAFFQKQCAFIIFACSINVFSFLVP